MTNWTTPASWTGSPSESFFNTHIRDNLNHLYENKPYTLLPGLEGSPDVAGNGGAGTSEEWSTTTTGLAWTPSSPTTVDSHTTVLSHIYINNQADTTDRLGLKAWAPAGAFDARLGGVSIHANSSVANVTAVFGLLITDSGNSNRLSVLVTYNYSTQVCTLAAYTYTGGSNTQRGNTITFGVGQPQIYMRITRDGSNNCSFYWSTNGKLWQFIATQAFTLTVANIGLYSDGNATAGFQAVADWLRTSV